MAKIANIEISNTKPLVVIAGPCLIEDNVYEIAGKLSEISSRKKFHLIFKASYDKANRQSINSPRGAGIKKGLEVLKNIRKEFGLPILTDIHLPEEAETVAETADCIQIPAFLCRQTDIIVAAAKTGKPINIKKGQFLAPIQMKFIVDKALSCGAKDVFVTERGTCFGYGDLVFDPRSIEIMKEFAPVVFDVTHSVQKPAQNQGSSGGERKFVPALARAAAAVGIAGLFIETHPAPEKALSDKETQWPLDKFEELIDEIMRIDLLVKNL